MQQMEFPSFPFAAGAPSNDFAIGDFNFDPNELQQLLGDASFLPTFEGIESFDVSQTSSSSGPSPRDDSGSGSEVDNNPRLKADSSHGKITEEERAMLAEEGVLIPEDAITLTKAEDRALKLVRRKIKNKLSAQDSRRKKKDYVDGLEQRVQACTAVNIDMQDKVANLTSENKSLRQQLQQLKQIVARLTGSTSATTTGTVLMVLALSFSMFVNPAQAPVTANTTAAFGAFGARTLKGMEPLPAATSTAALRDVISSWLGMAQRREDREDPPSLQRPRLGKGKAANCAAAGDAGCQVLDEL